MSTNEDRNSSEKTNQQESPVDSEKIISDLEKRVADIEMDEIIAGYTTEELQNLGFLGDDTIKVERSKYAQFKFSEGFEFPEGVVYLKHSPVDSVDQIDLIDLPSLTVVQPDKALIKFNIPPNKFNYYNKHFFDTPYATECNLLFDCKDNSIYITPKLPGRLVLAGQRLYLIPSDRDGKCIVKISDDHMSTFIDIYPSSGNGANLTEELILKELENQGVKAGIKTEAIREAVRSVTKSSNSENNIIAAEGKIAIDGKDAPVQFMFDTESMVEEFRILPDGRIDYRKQANIRMAHQGDILAIVGKPEPGTDGFDVLGNLIKARNGESSVLCAGQNVIMTDDGKFTAVADGQISLNGKVLSVLLHYTVEGDVDYGCGNISFNGNVTIKGSVLPGFEVKAEGDIVVMKNVDRAILKAGRDVIITSGIIGSKESVITCGRNLSAQYLQNAIVEVQGDITIHNSIIQSLVYSAGKVIVNGIKGMITGGYICALNGVEARIVGSQYGTKTIIEVGKDYLIQKKTQEIGDAIQFCVNNIKKIDTSLLAVYTSLKKGLILSPEKKQKVKAVQQKRTELAKHLEVMNWKKSELEKKSITNPLAALVVKDNVYTDVIIKIATHVLAVRSNVGHVKFLLNSKKDSIITDRI